MNNEKLTEENKQECFNAFIDEYKENNLFNKQQIIISELKELIGLFQKLCSMCGYEPELLINREIVDVEKDNYTQEDFAEAVYVYIQTYKDILADFMLFLINNNLLPNSVNE